MTQKNLPPAPQAQPEPPASPEARVAADVARRYGLPVDPGVVRFVPHGVSGQPVPVLHGTFLRDGTRAEAMARGRRMQARAIKFYHLRQREAAGQRSEP